MRRRRDSNTLPLFSSESAPEGHIRISWPDGSRFPLNDGGGHVQNWVWRDLRESPRPLIVSGYSSLDRFLDFASAANPEQHIRLLFGNEPFASRRDEFLLVGDDLPAQVEKYWLARGISLVRSAALIRTIEMLRAGSVEARYMRGGRMLHAKIYCGQNAATVGSSNFTEPGLVGQHEANARFGRDGLEASRFEELTSIAEGFWKLGAPYNDRLISLLEKLLQSVHWDEALARACAELLEGDWAQAYLREDYLGGASGLWPSQKQGIAQALLVLDQQGSVLIADATGAGKTRMGAYLIGAVHDHIVRSGRLWRGKALMIAPPAVIENWEREVLHTHVQLDIRSHGELSHKNSRRHGLRIEELKRAQILCVDEGHNFLNLKSQRTQLLLCNMADHVVMLTATPINRGLTDLLRIADVLGADNLEESTLEAFQRMLRARDFSRTLAEPEIEQLRAELRKFTVRRTKSVLNTLIQREPSAYRDAAGRECKFPRHEACVYVLDEPQSDRDLALQIRELANRLFGITHFIKPIEMPAVLYSQGVTEDQYLQGRLRSAKKFARYVVTKALRSSRAALIKHVHGTVAALKQFDLTQSFRKDETGNQYSKLKGIAGQIPENRLGIQLPDWLSEESAHREACLHDALIYEEIGKLALQLTDHRERGKVDLLKRLLNQHSLLLAFDSRPISLAIFRKYLAALGIDALLASGDAASDREKLLRAFARGSSEKRLVGLCSDSLSEGVNLQQAGAIVHLDMPSVVRVAEQRVGRVDRLDSPHAAIEAWWPDDAPEFALTSDERLVERFETVERLLGSNLPLPENLQRESGSARVTAKDMIEAFEKEAGTPWDGIDDAFSPVRGLIQGPQALVGQEIYERYRLVTERVLSRVSVVSAHSSWAFFCLSAGPFGAPRWLLMPGAQDEVQSDFLAITLSLRERLGSHVTNLPLDDAAARALNTFLLRLPDAERQLLSRRKQRAIEQLIDVIRQLLKYESSIKNQPNIEFLEKLFEVLANPRPDRLPDWNEVASRWLDVIRPVWFERLKEKRSRPLLLKDIQGELEARPDWLMQQLKEHFLTIPAPKSPDERVRACIIGIA